MYDGAAMIDSMVRSGWCASPTHANRVPTGRLTIGLSTTASRKRMGPIHDAARRPVQTSAIGTMTTINLRPTVATNSTSLVDTDVSENTGEATTIHIAGNASTTET